MNLFLNNNYINKATKNKINLKLSKQCTNI